MSIGIIDLKSMLSHYPIEAVRNWFVQQGPYIAMVCSKFRVSGGKCSYTVEDFLTILEHLLIVAQVVIKGKNYFFPFRNSTIGKEIKALYALKGSLLHLLATLE